MPDNVVYLRRQKCLFDSSIYISNLNRAKHADAIEALIRGHVLYLHSVVFEELLAGVKNNREEKILQQLKKPFLNAGRIITPTDQDWQETGAIMSQFLRSGSRSAHKIVSLTHDVLIAVSTRREGVRVITENRRDFERICKIKAFKFSVWQS